MTHLFIYLLPTFISYSLVRAFTVFSSFSLSMFSSTCRLSLK